MAKNFQSKKFVLCMFLGFALMVCYCVATLKDKDFSNELLVSGIGGLATIYCSANVAQKKLLENKEEL